MSDFPLLPLRKEVLNYVQHSEHLLTAAAASTNPPFTQHELGMIKAYATEVIHRLKTDLEPDK